MEIVGILAFILGVVFITRYYLKDSKMINTNYDLDSETKDEEKEETFASDMFADKKGILTMIALFIAIIVVIVSIYIGGI